jgi:TRAP-type C4-dicarboxylate transport system permease small subunit
MDRIREIFTKIGLCYSVAAGIAIFFMMFVGTFDVIGVNFFRKPLPGAKEMIQVLMPISAFGFLMYAQITHRHVEVDIFKERCSKRVRSLFNIIAYLIGLCVFIPMTLLTAEGAFHSISMGEYTSGSLGFPMYPARIAIPVATGLLCIQLVLDLIVETNYLLSRSKRGS